MSSRLTPVLSVAFNTYREAVRSKVLYSILFFGLFMILFSAALGELSLYQNERVIKDVGLFSLSLFGNVMAIFLGASFLYKEIERKSIYNIVTKPIHRWQYFVGKFLGLTFTLYLQLLIMTVLLAIVVSVWAEGFPVKMLVAASMVGVEVTMMTTIALLFSSFSTPFLSGFLSLGAFVIGKSASIIQNFAVSAENGILQSLLEFADRIAPALYIFNLSTEVTYDLAIPTQFLVQSTLYGLCYAAIMLVFGCLIFSRRDFA